MDFTAHIASLEGNARSMRALVEQARLLLAQMIEDEGVWRQRRDTLATLASGWADEAARADRVAKELRALMVRESSERAHDDAVAALVSP
jgi:hypothetical protein